MKVNINPENLDRMCESTMIFLEGQEVTAYLDWDNSYFYVWLEPSTSYEDFCEEIERDDMLGGLINDLAQIGVNRFYDLFFVNEFLKALCGDNNPAEFYLDDTLGCVCGA